jgi:hypothetical protein
MLGCPLQPHAYVRTNFRSYWRSFGQSDAENTGFGTLLPLVHARKTGEAKLPVERIDGDHRARANRGQQIQRDSFACPLTGTA